MTVRIQAAHNGETEQRLVDAPLVRHMAAELRVGRIPMSAVAQADGGPRYEFVGSANQGHRMLSGTNEGPMHLGAIATAVIRLAYNTPRTEYTVRFATEPMCRLSPWKVNAVTKPGLAVKIGQLVAKSLSLLIGDVRIALLGGNVGFVQRPSDRSEIVSFTIIEEKDADA